VIYALEKSSYDCVYGQTLMHRTKPCNCPMRLTQRSLDLVHSMSNRTMDWLDDRFKVRVVHKGYEQQRLDTLCVGL